jgi:hypothetical protein
VATVKLLAGWAGQNSNSCLKKYGLQILPLQAFPRNPYFPRRNRPGQALLSGAGQAVYADHHGSGAIIGRVQILISAFDVPQNEVNSARPWATRLQAILG